MSGDKPFTLYWRDGKREVVWGKTPARAMTIAGYGGGALRALDFYATGDDHAWQWNQSARDWEKAAEVATEEQGVVGHPTKEQ